MEFEETKNTRIQDASELIYDMREYDVPFHVRVAIDLDIRVGKWYTVEAVNTKITLTEMPERIARADPVVLAYDIETTKLPLKFPDAKFDKVMMISYMIDGEGFLITNREIVSQDIEDFEYTPKPEYPGVFAIFNEPDEKAVLLRFFEHIKEVKPTVIATFNGDFFDWPFVEARAIFHGINMYEEIGFQKDSEEEYKSSYCVHMDCFRWVKRDSYLPQGSQGLKAVTTAKLGYNPIEIDPELMTPYAIEKPQTMAEYSVSDAVATYYLYMKYVHPFIFSLCNIIPLNPDEVLRKGTGTLCEMLLMVQAYKGNIVLPNKHTDPLERFYKGHLIETETYVGGHVESLEAGVFRSDIPYKFDVDTTAVDELINDLDNALKFSIEIESKKKLEDVTNYDEVKQAIIKQLTILKNNPNRMEQPLIYHVDVASMYPNIMTTNRLQPDSMITEADCAACDFNRPGKTCDRRLPWAWRGEYFPAKMSEYQMIKRSLENDIFPSKRPGAPRRKFDELSSTERASHIKKRLGDYSKKTYARLHLTETIEKEAIVCQRENPFYVDTVRDFRDRRYDFKNLQKGWKKKVSEVPPGDTAGREEAKKMVVLYDSLQLAHKVILNSFYGYVMRKGSRWYSMEMAGVTCLTGATIIQLARSLVERLGRPLELDTDGIWCILPKAFPEDFTFKLKDGKKLFVSYPCVMLNHLVHAKFTNHQYQILTDPTSLKYKTISDNSIFFEVDGPYKAMVLPTSKEEDKNLKKRYAVFNEDGSLAELKGFELKRRGELKLIKSFQSQLFKRFLGGDTLEQCYEEVGKVANHWLDILDNKGADLDMEELLELISENKSMSKSLEEYGNQKSTSITTARRLAEFLGAEMVKDKGLACKYIIADRPAGAPVTERAIPVAIFSAPREEKSQYLRKWLKDNNLDDFDPRAIIDWPYYRERLGSTIQKIITIPAALQDVINPVPRIPHPDWLASRIRVRNDKSKQKSISSYFSAAKPDQMASSSSSSSTTVRDIEDAGFLNKQDTSDAKPKVAKVTVNTKRKNDAVDAEEPDQDAVPLPLHAPSIDAPYKEYLAYHKQLWRQQKLARERRSQIFGKDKMSTHSTSRLSGFIMDHVEKVYNNSMHILQLASTERPGEVRATVSINGKLQNIRIKVPRRIFVNFKSGFDLPNLEIPGASVQRVSNVLPTGVVSPNLFKIEMPEETYLAEKQKPNSLLNHPLVDGVFEGSISSVYNSLIDIGLCCDVSTSQTGLLGRGLSSGFEMDWLIPNAEEKYLEGTKFSYVYCLHIDSADYQVFTIIPTWSNQAYILVLKSSKNSQGLPNVSKIYNKLVQDKIARLRKNSHIFEYQETLDFEEQSFDNVSRLYKSMNKILEKLHNERGTQTILALQSPYPERLSYFVRTLNEFPVVKIRSSNLSLPSIGWQQVIGKKIVTQYFGLCKWLAYLLQLSKYGNIPLCNLKCDDVRFLIDVNYSRRLRSSGIVLWWSETPLPDEGGSEKDGIMKEMDSLDLPVVNNAGAYHNVCIDLSVRNLSVNTILTASLINESEGTDLSHLVVEGENNEIVPFVENSFSTPALNVLSSMIREWWNQAISNNTTADVMVHNFINWVASKDSLMYNRTLYYHVQTLSKKAFIQLIREFRKTGSKVVFANQNKILLLTTKSGVESAAAYADYIVKSVKSKPLFRFLDINVTQFWNTLLWMDEVNFGGKSCKTIAPENEVQVMDLCMNWHIKEFLPPILGDEFDRTIIEFIEAIYERWIQPSEEEGGEMNSTPRLTQLPKFQTANDNTDGDSNASLFKNVVKKMDKTIYRRIELLKRRFTDISNNVHDLPEDDPRLREFDFPKHPGAVNLNGELKVDPVLQLVKTICAVMGLSKELNLEIRLFRRHLLNIFDIREFSAEGNFANPSASVKIPQLICGFCSYVRDLDLCRNNELAIKRDGSNYYVWICENCHEEYDPIILEESLITEVRKMIKLYQVQDLKCTRCKRIREDDMSANCPCSGKWVETMSRNDILKKLKVYNHVAEYYDQRLLSDCLKELEG